MTNVYPFHRKHKGSTIDDLVTVFYADDMQILWNRRGIFYIRTTEYSVRSHIEYANVNTLEHAQRIGRQVYADYANEANRILDDND